MSEIRASKAESILNKEITLFKAAVIFVSVIFVTTVVLYAVGQRYFWRAPVVQTPTERGLNYYQALVDREPDKPEHWVNLGWHYYQMGEYDKALENHQKALTINPEHFGARYNAGLTYAQLSEFEKAVEHLTKATELNPIYWEAHLVLGISYMGLEKWAEAEVALAAAMDINRHSSDTNFYLGYLSEKTNDLENARLYYEEALRYNPNHVAANEGLQRISKTD
jgi:tetratricopeptide (TPR) repeat protein